jgi:hypothetical protein
MRPFLFILAITIYPSISYADEIDSQIDKACLRHAVSFVAKLKADVIGELSQDKADQALKLATETCQAYFKKEFSQNPEAIAAKNSDKESGDESSTNDWLTEKILSGDTTRKKGNERLRKLK